MQLSPTVRTALTAIAAMLAALAVALPTLGAPLWVGIAVGVVTAGLGALGIVPPQVGGTQQGIVNPSVTKPPAAAIDEQPHAPLE